jgi:predicted anti-sigma-YlaC factor YlaD
MAIRPHPHACDRARAWISLRLDDEISELEEALLDAHLSRCAACADYEASVRGVVLALRERPLERMEQPVAVAGRRRAFLRPAAVAPVAAVLAAVVGVTTVLSTQATKGPTAHGSGQLPVASVTDDQDLKQLRALRVLQLGGRPPLGSGVGSYGAVTARQVGSS